MTGDDSCDRGIRYASAVLEALNRIPREVSERYHDLIDASKRYAEDAIYYAEKGDCGTSLSAASYAEGLLDSLKYMGILEPKWPTPAWEQPTVFLAGTFDIIHPGHIELFRFAARHGKVHVVIARDENVAREKGKVPVLDEESRLRVVSAIRYVYKARLGDLEDKLKPLEDIRPDVIVLGPDQSFNPDLLAKLVEERTGKRPRVFRFMSKLEFSGKMKSTSDIILKICRESYCRNT
ncbi:MAG: cytidylyltransferase family protein [Desulfurococcales archaeon]|nr:cytidylyltransferase family protein [Desulfurococcales archaeon]